MLCLVLKIVAVLFLIGIEAIVRMIQTTIQMLKTGNQVDEGISYIKNHPPRWVIENNLLDDWESMPPNYRAYLSERYRLALETDKESLDQFIQFIREYYGV